MRKTVSVSLFILFSLDVFAQQQSVVVNGEIVRHDNSGPLLNAYVINKRTSEGVFIQNNKSFSVVALMSDTLLIGAQGCATGLLCFKDSIYRTSYYVHIALDSLNFKLNEVVITPVKTLKQIKAEEKQLGIIPNTDINKTVIPFSMRSMTLVIDIDYFYERYSHFEKEKRKVARLEDNELKENVLKDYLQLFVKAGIIVLAPEEFDKFIMYCNFTDEFVKNTSEYDLCIAIKDKLLEFNNRNIQIDSLHSVNKESK
jgi:hypothetical protein